MADALDSITKLIQSPPGQLVAGASLAGIVLKFFERVEGVLNEKALKALGEIDGATAGPSASVSIPASGRKGGKRSAAVRRKMRLAQRARWQRIRSETDRVPF